MKTVRLFATVAALTGVSLGNAQAADTGFYAGAGVGRVVITDRLTAGGDLFDQSTTPWRAFGGFRLGFLPLLDFAAEVGYRDTRQAEATVGAVSAQYRTRGADASVLAIFPFMGADLYARAGLVQYDLEKVQNATRTSFDGAAPLYGLGVGFRILNLGVRVEYERIRVNELRSLDGVMVSGTLGF